MQDWPPEMQKKNCISDGQPCMSALLFYCFTILLFYCFTISLQVQYCRGRCLGLAARDAKKFSTYHHVLQQNVVFASRTANLACRPSYSIFLLIYYTFSLHARDAKKRFCISDGQPCMSALLFYCFTNLLFFYFAPDTVLPRPMSGVDHPRCKKVFHVLPRTTAERSFCISDGQPCMSALLFYCLTILLFTISLQIQYCRGRCLGLAARDAKNFPRTTTHHHVLPRTTAERRFASRTANLACRPSYSIFLRIKYFTILLQIQYCRGRRLGLAARDAKKFSTYHHVLQQNVVFASRTANLACRPSYSIFLLIYYTFSLHARDAKKRFCISDGQPCMSALLFYCFTNLLFFYFAPDTVLPRPMFGVDHPRCKKVFHVLPRTTTYYSRT